MFFRNDAARLGSTNSPSKRAGSRRNRAASALRKAARPAIELMEVRVMLSALNPAAYASLGTFNPGPGTYTIDTTAGTLTGPSTSFTGVLSGGIEVFDFS